MMCMTGAAEKEMKMKKKNRKRYAFAIHIIICSLVFSACSKHARNSRDVGGQYFAEENQVKNYADGEISPFGLNIAPADEMGDWVIEWLSSVTVGEGFQYYIYSDPDSWDVYLYYPKEQANIRKLTNEDVAVDYSDNVLKVYIDPVNTGSGNTENEQIWLLHFAAYPFGAWPSEVELYWDGREVLCEDAVVSE